MGQCYGKSVTAAEVKNRAIDQHMEQDEQLQSRILKVLMLGAGESGKSTLFRQLKVLFTENKEFTPQELSHFSTAISANVISGAQSLITEAEHYSQLKSTKGKTAAAAIKSWDPKKPVHENDVNILLDFWKDDTVQDIWEHNEQLQVPDSFSYYMEENNLKRLAQDGYKPTFNDILRVRIRTTGVVIQRVDIDGAQFELHDVGGQRNERRKWLHHFDQVTTVLFVAALSEYNQVLFEDYNYSRQQESLDIFKELLRNPNFSKTPFLLFLNKDDLFRQKLIKYPFKVTEGAHRRNVDFKGQELDMSKQYACDGSDKEYNKAYGDAIEYLKNLYRSQRQNEREQDIIIHVTTSLNSANVEHIMKACKEIILRKTFDLHYTLGV
eukprot:maker-scaffold_1-snap-gene-29.45-mRNA-1 protein AED:0.00 eAED:0.00 QI:143/1/1/1/1/1/2/108/380